MLIRSKRLISLYTITTIIILCLIGSACPAQRGGDNAGADLSSTRMQRPRIRIMAATPWLGAAVKDLPRELKTQGVQVESVIADSPADKTGLRNEDIITGLDSKPVGSAKEFQDMVSKLTIGTEYSMSILRGNDAISLTICPATWSAGKPVTFFNDTPAPRKGPLDINTLKYALIDPKTHVVVFIGKYDSDYDTGPIPYADILSSVQNNMYPSFSLEPNDQQRQQIMLVDRMISADIKQMNNPDYCNQWGRKLSNLLMNDPSLKADHERFIKNCANAMGLSGDELKQIFDMVAGKESLSQNDGLQLIVKLMRGIGVPKAADGMNALMSGSTLEEKFRSMADALGLTSQYEELEKKNLSFDQLKNESAILCISEMCRQFEAPESEIQSVVSSIRSGQQGSDAIINYMSEQISKFITNKVGGRMINGLVLGPDVLAKMYDLPVPQSDLVYKNVDSNSVLGDILFRSDYRLKSICAYPDVRDKVPAHLTNQEFIQKEASAENYDLSAGSQADIGHKLVPADVEMRVSPDGSIVEFQNSKVKVVSWVRGLKADKTASNFINEVTPKYSDYITQHYDEYAKVYPEWHKLSEVAKIIAFARWAKQNNYTVKVEDISNVKITHPQCVDGFWSAVFQVNGEKPSLTVVAEGGASFDQSEGEDWIKTKPDVTVTSDISKQLVASTIFAEQAANSALSGNLESASDLAGKSARAMTGEIDLTTLPSLDGIPAPSEPAAYAEATGTAINQASDCLKQMESAQKDLARAQELAATSPEEAKKLTEQATKAQDEAHEKLEQIIHGVSTYKTDPSKAEDVAVALKNGTGVVTPINGNTSSNTQVAQATTTSATDTPTKPEDGAARCAELKAKLEEVNKQIVSTRDVLLKLNASVRADSKQFDEWEKAADAAFDRCVGIAADTVIDFGAGELAERYDTIHELAEKLPNKPEDLIEKYRLLASLARRLKEAKATNDLNGLYARENKTDEEVYESLRDGISQIVGILNLDKTVPGAFWKYLNLGSDMAYNLTQLYHGWHNVSTLEANNDRYAEAVKKLADRMKDLVEKQKKLEQQIEAEGNN